MTEVSTLEFCGQKVAYDTDNDAARWRVETIFEKEPDTVSWIAQFREGEILWDIGANVGMYTMMASKGRGVAVYAFEPESQNYALLNRNIHLNGLSENITAFCAAVSDVSGMDHLFLSQFGTGGSCHSFGEQVGFNLKPRQSPFRQGCLSVTIDELVEKNILPVPDHIKIDVDGFEHKVLAGAEKTLKNPKLQSVLVEINTNLPEHQAIIKYMQSIGFEYDQWQVHAFMRKEGPFVGCANFIFTRESMAGRFDFSEFEEKSDGPGGSVDVPEQNVIDIEHTQNHFQHHLSDLQVSTYPYPHFYGKGILPDEVYKGLMANKPSDEAFQSIADTGRVGGGAYKNRNLVILNEENVNKFPADIRPFWLSISAWLNSTEFGTTLIRKFYAQLQELEIIGKDKKVDLFPEIILLRDKTGYSIGPHSDAPKRLLSFFFYLPETDENEDLGTSVFIPKDPTFTCVGGPHHKFEAFDKIKTASYVPNSCFGFLKTNNSFHGVEPITRPNVNRDSICCILKHR